MVQIQKTEGPGFAQSGYVKNYAVTKVVTPRSSPATQTAGKLRYEKNDIVRVKITAVTEEGAEGEILNLPEGNKK
jgi:hypothetical protein